MGNDQSGQTVPPPYTDETNIIYEEGDRGTFSFDVANGGYLAQFDYDDGDTFNVEFRGPAPLTAAMSERGYLNSIGYSPKGLAGYLWLNGNSLLVDYYRPK